MYFCKNFTNCRSIYVYSHNTYYGFGEEMNACMKTATSCAICGYCSNVGLTDCRHIDVFCRLMFDSEESPILEQDCFLRDIHCVGNVLKMYFR